MKICIAVSDTKVVSIEVDPLGTIEDIKVLVECEIGVPMSVQRLLFQGKLLQDTAQILDSGVLEGDILHLQTESNPIRGQALSLLQQANSQPSFLNYLESQNPALAQVVRAGNLEAIEQALMNTVMNNEKMKMEKLKQEAALEADPLDPSAQMEIQNRIQQKNINENLKYAEEFTPEVFGSVEMLYIDCKVNKIAVQAFVDSGAQNTIMSKRCAERLQIMRLVDTRFKGQARGVGVGVIIGRVHAVNLEIGGKFFDCCFHVLETSSIDMLFGLDMLKRHQCCIDLHANVLTLHAGETIIPFLHEASIKKNFEEFEEAGEMMVPEENTRAENRVEEKKAEEKKVEEAKIEKGPEPARIESIAEPPKPQAVLNTNTAYNIKVGKITNLGFTVQEAEEALRLFKGDEERAAAYLAEKSNMFDF